MLRKAVGVVLVVAVVLVFSPLAHAAERSYWSHSKGHFENTNGNKWSEKINDETKEWNEDKRTDDYVQLSRRNADDELVIVRLFSDHADRKVGKNGDFAKLYDGKWK